MFSTEQVCVLYAEHDVRARRRADRGLPPQAPDAAALMLHVAAHGRHDPNPALHVQLAI